MSKLQFYLGKIEKSNSTYKLYKLLSNLYYNILIDLCCYVATMASEKRFASRPIN